MSNDLSQPRIEKVVINVGLSKNLAIPNLKDFTEESLKIISGQKPAPTLARQSVSAFKIRKNEQIGWKVTLRGKRMNNFLDKLIHFTLPRIRDFRGLDKKNLDQQGNLNIGIKEQIVFPEIKAEDVEKIHGLEISVKVKAKNREESLTFLKEKGFPFKAEQGTTKDNKGK